MASRKFSSLREEFSLRFLSRCTEKIVSQYVLIASGACQQNIRHNVSTTMDFSVVFDSVPVDVMVYFYMIAILVLGALLLCFLYFCLPSYVSKVGELTLSSSSRTFMFFSHNGWVFSLPLAPMMSETCRDAYRGILSRMSEFSPAASHMMIRFCCRAHQLDLFLAKVVSTYCDDI